MTKKNSNSNELNLKPVRGLDRKQIVGMLVRMPITKDGTKFPAVLGAVYDSSSARVKGLWWRLPRGPFSAQITDTTPEGEKRGIKVKLEATTLAAARKELEDLRTQSRNGCLPVLGKTPGFAEYAKGYQQAIKAEQKKRPSTIYSECFPIDWWCRQLKTLQLNKITLPIIRRGIAKLASTGRSGKPLEKRSLNYYATVMRNILNRAVEDGWLKTMPIPPKSLWYKPDRAERPLFTFEEKTRLCEAALAHCPRRGQELVDLINLLCSCGARVGATLKLRWADVDWSNRQLIIARDGSAKSKTFRRVEFNPELERHLRDMHQRRKDNEFLFPSSRSAGKSKPSETLRGVLNKAREAAGLGKERKEQVGRAVSFHDCRHHFCSMAIMQGADYRTIADWLGHSDGGVLVGQTYGHVSDDHKRRMADKLNLAPLIIDGGRKTA